MLSLTPTCKIAAEPPPLHYWPNHTVIHTIGQKQTIVGQQQILYGMFMYKTERHKRLHGSDDTSITVNILIVTGVHVLYKTNNVPQTSTMDHT